MDLREATGCWGPPHPSSASSASAGESTALGTLRGSSDADVGAEDEDWPANPWQAQADAHVMQLRQADAGGIAFGIPLVLCSAGLQCQGPQQFQAAGSQTEDGMLLRMMNDLEGQVAYHEDLAAKRDQELLELRALSVHLEAEARLAAEAARRHAEVDALKQTSEALSSRNDFLTALVNRFEQKTMGLQRQIDNLNLAKAQAEMHADELRGELQAAVAEATEHMEARDSAQEHAEDLKIANSEVKEQLSECEEAAEGTAVVLRDLRREHNRKTQELARRQQLLERRNNQVSAESRHQDKPTSHPDAGSHPGPSGGAGQAEEAPEAKELRELKALNLQLIERLGQERSAHTKARDTSQEVSNENQTLSARIDSLSGQLYTLAGVNDALSDELSAANAACCAVMTGVDCDRLDCMS